MKKVISIFAALLISIIANAQQTLVHVDVSSFGNYDITGKYIYIIPGDPNIELDDIEFQYYKDILKQGFLRQKAIPTDEESKADLCVLLDYAIADKSYVGIVSTPVWGVTGVRSVTTNSNTTGSVYGSGTTSVYGNTIIGDASAYGNSATNTTRSYTYNHGITGYRQDSKEISKFKRVANIYAYDNKVKTGKPKLLWKTNLDSEGSSNDLADIFCNLINAGVGYFGDATNGKEKVRVFKVDPDSYFMKKNFFLKNNVIVNPTNYNKGTSENMILRALLLNKNSTSILIYIVKGDFSYALGDPILGQKKIKIKIPENTYILYNDKKIAIESAFTEKENLVGQTLSFGQGSYPIWLNFPIELKKGDTFSLVAYKNKKEKEILFEYKNLVVQ